MTPSDISLIIYNLALLPVLFFSILFFLLTALNLLVDRPRRHPKARTLPAVTIQVPSFNDAVAVRCVEACLKQRYPARLVDIMILDDSTDLATQRVLRALAKKYSGKITYVHRKNRHGYKPGALQAAAHRVRGEIVVVFDADFIPPADFLLKIVQPFENERVAIVQGRQTLLNKDVNLVSRFAAYLLMAYHTIVMPINHKTNTVFFCGTAGAIRRSAMEEVGGWNTDSITEDTDLSVRLLSRGYRAVYLPIEVPSEVPITLEAFLKQQMRWCFGNIRVWIDNRNLILGKSQLGFVQRFMISLLTLGNFVAPVVLLMTVAGMLGWFLGEVQLVTLTQVWEFIIAFAYTAGFLTMGLVTLIKHRSAKEFPHLLLATFTVSIILAIANTIAIYKALFRKNSYVFVKERNSWICTAKQGNRAYT
jgi:cellulose synthase/poly-beta-1,6-N-acetylglucosamine synthase-like glycosyltransferase